MTKPDWPIREYDAQDEWAVEQHPREDASPTKHDLSCGTLIVRHVATGEYWGHEVHMSYNDGWQDPEWFGGEWRQMRKVTVTRTEWEVVK